MVAAVLRCASIVRRVPTKRNQPRRFTCACIQFEVRRADVARNLAEAEAGLRLAAAAGARLAVLPEMWPTSFVPHYPRALIDASGEAEQRIVQLSAELQMVIVGGGVEAEGSKLYNRALVAEHGQVRGSFRKIHSFSPHGEHHVFSGGAVPLVLETSIGRLGVLICYDLRFPELVRWYFDAEVEVLAVPAQWPEARAEHWRTLLCARAIENQMFVVGCNRCGPDVSLKSDDPLMFPGDSRIVDPMGEVLAAGSGETGPVIAEIDVRRARMMRRVLPIAKDRRPDVYRAIWQTPWSTNAAPPAITKRTRVDDPS